MGYIYKITNLKTGKHYIGQTRQEYECRWKAHMRAKDDPSKHHLPLYKMLSSTAVEDIKFEVVEKVSDSVLDKHEVWWIAFYDSYHNGYNANEGNAIEVRNLKQRIAMEV